MISVIPSSIGLDAPPQQREDHNDDDHAGGSTKLITHDNSSRGRSNVNEGVNPNSDGDYINVGHEDPIDPNPLSRDIYSDTPGRNELGAPPTTIATRQLVKKLKYSCDD